MSAYRDRWFISVVLAMLVAGASCSPGEDDGTGPEDSGAIALSLDPTSLSIQQGASGVVTARITRSGGFTGGVSLSVTVAVSGGLTFQTLFKGGDHICGVDATGVPYCWGMDDQGQLGNGVGAPNQCGGLDCSIVPIPVAGGHLFREMSAYGCTCGVDMAGDTWCWGDDSAEQLGDGPGLTGQDTPIKIT